MDNKVLPIYRNDIDSLRAIAVLAVILFHMGYLPNGYLGVDVFFVISGYLITKIIYAEVIENKFSIYQFYLRRIRRIIPLVLFTTFVALITGLFVMLPDDLENLSQSVIATNFFANNILLKITTVNYWNIINDYKPLMHTWSLGIEEQFYLVYPLLFLICNKKRVKWILPILVVLTGFSLFLFFFSTNEAVKFFTIPFRFFELSLGGIGAIVFKEIGIQSKYKLFLIIALLVLLYLETNIQNHLKLIAVVLVSFGILVSNYDYNKWNAFILENKVMIGIGKISFSLYMWHQIVLAFTRYFIVETISTTNAVFIGITILILSLLSYYFIEQPFRNKEKIKNTVLLFLTGVGCIISTALAFYIYSISGILKDVPELDIIKENTKRNSNIIDVKRNPHISYNARIYDLNKEFTSSKKIKVVIYGSSFARDWGNVLLESKYGNQIELSYVEDINYCKNFEERIRQAKCIFLAEKNGTNRSWLDSIARIYPIDTSKVWNVGLKNFGANNGIYYNRKNNPDYCSQRTKMIAGILERNELLKKQWGNKYIDVIGSIIDKKNTIPVFTNQCKFISQDCKHLTKSGATYFGEIIDLKLYLNP
ncbi:acyltransferase family protein [Flavobacterium luteum]|uniref:Acyltransferase n=1 Tax=Flavobacterium luteum TaxID=2026654 RepID=A0A7J5A7N6_9FLAO|nr:acyltransferase [Flavobacterium luteum]KAB1153584.1 acyltransferase [Flavobacterium luteum]